jgi:hypothetical protein
MNKLGIMTETRRNALRPTSLAVGIIISCLAIVFVSLHAAYPSTAATAKFLGYLLVFNLLPGFVVTRLILPRAKEGGVYLIFSLGIGILTNALAITALWSIGQLYFLFMLPVLAGGIAIMRLSRVSLTELFADQKVESNGFCWILGTLFLCFTALLGVGFINAGEYVESFSFHAAFQGVIIRGLEFGWPPPNLTLPEVAWSYNYLAHLWLLGVKLTTGLPIDVLVTRYGPVLLGGASASLMLAFGRYVVGLVWWIAALPVICVYWVIGIAPISSGLFASFMPFGANLILSPFLGILAFFVTLAFVLEKRSTQRSYLFVRIATLGVLIFLATGARGVCPPILLCALALRSIVSRRQNEKLRENIVDLVAAIAGFAAGLVFFFTVGTGFSGAGVLKFTGQPFSLLTGADQDVMTLGRTLTGWGFAALPAGMVAFAVIVIFQAAFLTPALPTAFMEMRKRSRDADILLIGSAIAGIVAVFLTEAPGLSHYTFLYFANISLSLLGGLGLQHTIHTIRSENHQSWRSLRFRLAALVMISLLACLHLVQLPIGTVKWVGNHWAASALSLASFSSEPLPPLARCMRDQDAELLATAHRASPAAVVILLTEDSCGSFWWIVRSPVQTLGEYSLSYVPGRAMESALQEKIVLQGQHMSDALASARRGILDVPDVIAIAKTFNNQGPVFVMAARRLTVQADAVLQMIDANDSFVLWQIFAPGHDQTAFQPVR